MENLVFLCVLLLAVIQTGQALRCYACDTATSSYCNDHDFQLGRLPAIICGVSIMPNQRAACLKKVMKDQHRGTFNISRQCILTPPSNDICQAYYGYDVTECKICNDDMCNGPSTTPVPPNVGGQLLPQANAGLSFSSVTCYACTNSTSKNCEAFDKKKIPTETCYSSDRSFTATCGVILTRNKYTKESIFKRMCMSTGKECLPSPTEDTLLCTTCADNHCNSALSTSLNIVALISTLIFVFATSFNN